jgi:hypothetical protein
MNFNAHIVASGDIETKRVFIGDGSGITNLQADQLTGTVPSGNLPADVVYNIDLVNASGDLVGRISAASGELNARLEASGLTLDTKINVASGDLQSQLDAISAGNVDSISGIDGGVSYDGDVAISGLGALVYGSGATLVIEPDVRRAELVFTSGVNTAVLTHGYGERPLVQIFDLNENQVWADVSHNSVNEVQADFLELQTGRLIVIG